jgi:dihydroneopterin aldolase
MKTIGLSGIQILKVCGFGREREKPQKLEVDIEIETDFTELAEKDNLEYGIDLNNLYYVIEKSIEGEIYTIETIANRIFQNLKNLQSVKKVSVKVKKPNPTVEGNAKFSFVMIEE